MSAYPLQKLLSLWQQERLKVEQAIGQILQHLLAQEQEIKDLQRRLPKPRQLNAVQNENTRLWPVGMNMLVAQIIRVCFI